MAMLGVEIWKTEGSESFYSPFWWRSDYYGGGEGKIFLLFDILFEADFMNSKQAHPFNYSLQKNCWTSEVNGFSAPNAHLPGSQMECLGLDGHKGMVRPPPPSHPSITWMFCALLSFAYTL